MATGGAQDPVRATMLAVLQQLNRAESMHEGRERDQALAYGDLERLLHGFWATERPEVRLPQILGLLVRNGMVGAHRSTGPRAQATTAARSATAHYFRITTTGKQFLIEALAKTDRIA
jgi:hypothetical protein